MRRFFAFLVLAALLAGFVPGSVMPVQRASAQGPGSAEKVSGRLDLEVRAKVEAIRSRSPGAASFPQQSAPAIPLEAMPATPGALATQLIFIHLAQPPTQAEIDDMRANGVVPYPDSWIPPVGDQTTGFITAEMPVDQLAALAGRTYVQRLETAEAAFTPQNDLAAQAMGVPSVWSSGYNGTGVRVAVLDSGLDLTNPDIPTPVATRDYSNYPGVLDDTIANTVTGHGTHVTGSVLGRGTASSGVYKGIAPGADLVFLKIGNDTNGSSTTAAIVAAMKAAVDTYGVKVITMSYGGWDDYHDGTSEEAQAVDYAVSRGATVFLSAGNDATSAQHYSGTVGPLSATGDIRVDITNATSNDVFLQYNLVWFDGPGTRNDLALEYYNSSHNLIGTTNLPQAQSSRGTESEYSYYGYAPQGNSTWYLRVRNNSQHSQFFHIYYALGGSKAKFNNPDPDYTIASPADADGAIAVGAYTTRTRWYDYANSGWQYGTETVGQIATFSDHGPRVDAGAPRKPDLVAPGSAIISARDNVVYPWSSRSASYVDDNGPNVNDSAKNNGAGPADYYVMEGTSMASPIAAGVAALLLQKHPDWTPAQVKNAMQSTATDKGAAGPDSVYGYGLVNAQAAFSIDQAVTTDNATNISSSSAMFGGTLTGLGMASSSNVSFQWGPASGNYTFETPPVSMNTTGNFSAGIGGLSANTTYYFRAKAAGDGVSFGQEQSAATLPAAPLVDTGNATGISLTLAHLNGTVISLGVAPTANVSFQWGLTSGNYTVETARQTANVTGAFGADLIGLSENVTYYFRAKAVGNGTAYGAENSFATLASPSAATGNATNVGDFSATLNGNLVSRGSAATANVSFQVGVSSGNLTGTTSTAPMVAPGQFSASLTGLSANTTYYFRAAATGDGATFGAEKSFTTLPTTPPSVSTGNATAVTLMSAQVNGNLTSLGSAASANVSFQWGTASGNLTFETASVPASLTGVFTGSITGLSANTTYYYRAHVVGHGAAFGGEASFTTPVGRTLTTAVNGGGSVSPAAGLHQYPLGSSVPVSAVPVSGWKFSNWTGNVTSPNTAATSVLLDIDKTVTANFVPLPPPPQATGGGGGGGGGGGATASSVSLSGLSSDTQLYVTASGLVPTAVKLTSPANDCTLEIPAGTTLTATSGAPVMSLTRVEPGTPPQPPGGKALITVEEFGPDGATFTIPLTLTLAFDKARMPPGVSDSDLVIAFWDGGQWVPLETTLNRDAGSLSAGIRHFTMFGILAPVAVPAPPIAAAEPPRAVPTIPVPPVNAVPAPTAPFVSAPVRIPAPASFNVTGLSIEPSSAHPGEQVKISIVVANNGGTEGELAVTLSIDGATQGTSPVTLGPGDSRTSGFTVTPNTTGQHIVDVNGVVGSFEIQAPLAETDVRASILPAAKAQLDRGNALRVAAVLLSLGLVVGIAWAMSRRRNRRLPE